MRRSSEELEDELGSDWTRNYPIFMPFFPGFAGRGVGCSLRLLAMYLLPSIVLEGLSRCIDDLQP